MLMTLFYFLNHRLLNVVLKESERMGLEINYTKTKCLVVSKKSSPKCNLKLKEQIIKQVSSFNYLGSMITEDARCETEIKRRIALAKSALNSDKSKNEYEDQNKSIELLHLPSTYVW